MVGPDGELAALQVVSEMSDACKHAIELPVKGTVGQLGWFQLGREKPQGPKVGSG